MAKAYLVLTDGSIFEGNSYGAKGHTSGEVVFNTSMTGYQEMLTDPSYAGQILVLTYPMIGNYGTDNSVEESEIIQPEGLIVREIAPFGSHVRSKQELDRFLDERKIIAIDGVDTRAITKRLRKDGVMAGTITSDEQPEQALIRLRQADIYGRTNWVSHVTCKKMYTWNEKTEKEFHVVVLDSGVKRNIMRSLDNRGCFVTVVPSHTTAKEVLDLKPNGIVFSPGPGDPSLLDVQVKEAKLLIGKKPIFGICLGHQILARALGAGTFKLPFGHRGGNHPVKELATNKVTITAQNHGYAVDPDELQSDAFVSHLNVNDSTVEGIAMKTEPLFTIQFHSEASPGPLDSMNIFDQFIEQMRNNG